MKTFWKTGLLLLLLLQVGYQAAAALRLRGSAYPSQQLANTKRPLEQPTNAAPESRIVGGQRVAVGEAPWMVSVQNQFGFHICGGVIVDVYNVLTAASCVAGLRARRLIVNTGTIDWANQTSKAYVVEAINIHCAFDDPLYNNDVAILRLQDPINFDDVTATIEVYAFKEFLPGDKLTFYGWGSQDISEPYQRYLYKGEGIYMPNSYCQAKLEANDDVGMGHMCVQPLAGNGACHGDTGGPVLNADGQLVGIGNWGVPCGHGFPDVYASAAFYHDWVTTIVRHCMLVN